MTDNTLDDSLPAMRILARRLWRKSQQSLVEFAQGCADRAAHYDCDLDAQWATTDAAITVAYRVNRRHPNKACEAAVAAAECEAAAASDRAGSKRHDVYTNRLQESIIELVRRIEA